MSATSATVNGRECEMMVAQRHRQIPPTLSLSPPCRNSQKRLRHSNRPYKGRIIHHGTRSQSHRHRRPARQRQAPVWLSQAKARTRRDTKRNAQRRVCMRCTLRELHGKTPIDIVYSQPADTGTGNNINTQLVYAVNCLKVRNL